MMKKTTLASLVVGVALCTMASCGTGLEVASVPKIRNLGVALSDCPDTCSSGGQFGDFKFGSDNSPIIFGGIVDGNKRIPNIELRPLAGADVIAPMDGFVTDVYLNEEDNDYAITFRAGAGSIYRVEIDHVLDAQVSAGDYVTAGQVIAKAGVWDSTYGRVELQINRGETYVCPMRFLDPSIAESFRAEFAEFLSDWEAAANNTTLYDESGMSVTGCMADEYGQDDV